MDILTTLPTDTFVSAAFAELLEDVTNLLSAAQTQKPCDKDEIGFWRRQLNALNKAEYNHKQGVRVVIGDSAYLLPSASRPGALVHRLVKQGGIVVCSCEAGQKGTLCWHHMLINVIERAAELETLAALGKAEEIGGSGPEMTPTAAAHQLLEVRLAETAAIIDTMRSAQGRAALSSTPPVDIPDEEAPTEEGDGPPVWPEENGRALGYRLAQARRRSAYFASAFYLEAA